MFQYFLGYRVVLALSHQGCTWVRQVSIFWECTTELGIMTIRPHCQIMLICWENDCLCLPMRLPGPEFSPHQWRQRQQGDSSPRLGTARREGMWQGVKCRQRHSNLARNGVTGSSWTCAYTTQKILRGNSISLTFQRCPRHLIDNSCHGM
jgi:hypothetical protein